MRLAFSWLVWCMALFSAPFDADAVHLRTVGTTKLVVFEADRATLIYTVVTLDGLLATMSGGAPGCAGSRFAAVREAQ